MEKKGRGEGSGGQVQESTGTKMYMAMMSSPACEGYHRVHGAHSLAFVSVEWKMLGNNACTL